MISHRDLYHNTMQVDVMSQRIGREREVRGRCSCIFSAETLTGCSPQPRRRKSLLALQHFHFIIRWGQTRLYCVFSLRRPHLSSSLNGTSTSSSRPFSSRLL